MINRLNVSCESNMDNFRVIITKIGDKTSVVMEHCEEDEFDTEDEDEYIPLDELIKDARRERIERYMENIDDEHVEDKGTGDDGSDKTRVRDRDERYDDDEEFV